MNTKDGKKVKGKKAAVVDDLSNLPSHIAYEPDPDPVEAAPTVDPAPPDPEPEPPKLDTRPMTPENFPDKFDIFGNIL